MSSKKILCGVDLGGTKLAVGLLNPDGKIVDRTTVYDHINKNEYEICSQIGLLVKELLQQNGFVESDLLGIGLGFPGHIRYKEGVVITSSNFRRFSMKNFPIRRTIQDLFTEKIPVLTDNDANAHAMAEFLFGAGRSYNTMIYVTVSTGIGAGLILDGKLYRGISGTAGEIGHTIVNPFSSIRCGCGNYGCLMAHACGLSICETVRTKTSEGVPTSLPIESCTSDEQIDGRFILEGLKGNDPLATAVMEEYADYFGIGLHNLFQIFNPPIIVIGGGLLNWGSTYINRVKQKFYTLARDMIYDEIRIETSELGPDAGLIGAASLLLEKEVC